MTRAKDSATAVVGLRRAGEHRQTNLNAMTAQTAIEFAKPAAGFAGFGHLRRFGPAGRLRRRASRCCGVLAQTLMLTATSIQE
jgi:hypothetical protein